MLEEMKGRKLVDLFKEGLLKVGDEIPYNDQGEKEYISSFKANGYGEQYLSRPNIKISWQILGIDNYCGEETLKLISKEPLMPVRLQGATGALNGVAELNTIAFKLYGGGKEVLLAKNFDREELDKLLQIEYIISPEGMAAYEGYMDRFSGKDCVWKGSGLYGEVEGFSPELFLQGTGKQKMEGYLGYVVIPENKVWNERACQVLFHKREPYWICEKIAANYWNIERDKVRTHYGIRVGFPDVLKMEQLFISNGFTYVKRACLRPVIYLQPDATYDF